MKRICVVTAGHLASTPRMLKAADAFHEAGYDVRVVCAEHMDWCVQAGARLRAARAFRCDIVDWHAQTGRSIYRRSRWRHKALRLLAAGVGPGRLGLSTLARVACRVGSELLSQATAQPADFIYGGTSGGLAIAALAARKMGVPYALDLEDFHSGEQQQQQQNGAARLSHQVISAIERDVLPRAAFLTAGSQPIAEAYADTYGVRPITINNVFPLPAQPPHWDRPSEAPLRLYWFSQVVGPGRGLEDAVEAAGSLNQPVWLGLLGWNEGDYPGKLQDWAARSFPRLKLEFLGNRPAEDMVDVARQADIGLALETGQPLNRDLCCTNKIFTYILAGLAVAGTATRGQRPVLEDLGEGGWLYPPGDAAALAKGLRRWADQPGTLRQAQQAAWQAAQRRWHWEHPLERGALLDALAQVCPPR